MSNGFVSGVFTVKLNKVDGDLIVTGNSKLVKLYAINYVGDSGRASTIEIESILEVERLYETLGKILGK